MNLEQHFRKRPVFLTGHTGFKGSWLALWLAKLGAQVHGYALPPPSEPNNFGVSNVREVLAADYRADIRDAAKLNAAMQSAAPDVVFHLAAQALVRESYISPRETFDVNVIGTASVLDAVRALKRPCVVVIVTSDKCYENREQPQGYRETDAMGGYDPYSASKGAAELLVAAYRRSFFHPEKLAEHGVKVATARAGNVIGGGDWAKDRIVTDIVAALHAGQPVPVRNPRATRPWQHVLEPLSGYLTLAAKMLSSDDPKWCSGWNFGPQEDEVASVAELVTKFCAAYGGGKWEDRSSKTQPHEAGLLRLNIDKAVNKLGWQPRWKLDETVRRTAEWYRKFYSAPCAEMRRACFENIEAYEG